MGGQNSKHTPEAQAMPPKIRPLLQRKYEQIKARIRARKLKTDTAPSKKQLLKPEDDIEEEDTSVFQSLQSSPDRSVTSPKLQTVPEKKTSKVAPVLVDHDEIKDQKKEGNKPEFQPLQASPDHSVTSLKVQTVPEKKTSKVAPALVDHDEIKDQKKEEGKSDNSIEENKEKESGEEAKVVPVYIGGVFALEQATDGEEENEDQEDMRRSINYEMWDSSPSFRVYCQQEPTEFEKELEKQTDKDASKQDNTSSRDEEKNHQKTPSASSSVDSIPDNNGQDTKTKKKSRRIRMKNPFHMGGPADCSVKNLLNVKGCAGAGHGHDRDTLLDEKSAAT